MNTLSRAILALGRRRLIPALIPGSYPMARVADGVVTDDVAGVEPVNNSSEG